MTTTQVLNMIIIHKVAETVIHLNEDSRRRAVEGPKEGGVRSRRAEIARIPVKELPLEWSITTQSLS